MELNATEITHKNNDNLWGIHTQNNVRKQGTPGNTRTELNKIGHDIKL